MRVSQCLTHRGANASVAGDDAEAVCVEPPVPSSSQGKRTRPEVDLDPELELVKLVELVEIPLFPVCLARRVA